MEIVSLTVKTRRGVITNQVQLVDIDDVAAPIREVTPGGDAIFTLREGKKGPFFNQNTNNAITEYTTQQTLAQIAVLAGSVFTANILTYKGRSLAGTPLMGFNAQFVCGTIIPFSGGSKFFYQEDSDPDLVMYTCRQTPAQILAQITNNSIIAAWLQNGNINGSLKYIGTNDNFDFPIRTNGIERARFAATGEFGIGVAPEAGIKLKVVGAAPGQFKLVDTTQGVGKVLTSDANGLATWQTLSAMSQIDITYDALMALYVAGTMQPGFYNITDRADHGLVIQCVSPTQLSEFGVGKYLNPDFQGVGNYISVQSLSGIPYTATIGLWTVNVEPTLVDGDVVFYNGLMWQLISAADVNGSDPSSNPVAYFPLDKSTINIYGYNVVGYVEESDVVGYDFLNDWLFYRADKRGNKYSYCQATDYITRGTGSSQIKNFQWGRDANYSNVINEGFLSNLNDPAQIYSNTLGFAAYLYNNTFNDGALPIKIFSNVLGVWSSITNNTFENGSRMYENTLGYNAGISSCTLDTNSYLYRNIADYGSIIDSIGMTGACGVYENIIGPNAVFTEISMADGSILNGNRLGNNSVIGSNTMGPNSNIGNNTLADEASMQFIILGDTGVVAYNILDYKAYFVTFNNGVQSSVSYNKLGANAFMDTITLTAVSGTSPIMNNNILGNSAFFQNLTLTGQSATSLSNNILDEGASMTTFTTIQDGAVISFNELFNGASILALSMEPNCLFQSNTLGQQSVISAFVLGYAIGSGQISQVVGNTIGANCNINTITLAPNVTGCQFSTNIFDNGILFRRKTLDDVFFVSNNVGIASGTTETYSTNISSKTCRPGYSNFTLNLDMSDVTIFTGGVLSVPQKGSYCGIFTLTNNTGQTITTILSLPTTHVSRFYVQAGNTQSFQPTAIAGIAVAGSISSPSAATDVIIGRSTVGDWVEYAKAGNFNDRQNISKKV